MSKSKARVSEKEVVLLGLIAEGPIHAYGLEQKMRERKITEWADIGFSSIYRVLDGLTRKRLISTRLVQGGQGAARKVHEITGRGRAMLAAGVVEHLSTMTKMKMPLSVGLAFACNGRHADVVRSLAARAAAFAEVLGAVEGYRRQYHGEMPPVNAVNEKGLLRQHWLGVHLLFDHFRRHLAAEHDFLTGALALLDNPEGETFFVGSAARAATETEVK